MWARYPKKKKIVTPSKAIEPVQKPLSPDLLINALKKTIEKKKRNSLSELAKQFNVDKQKIENALKKLKSNFEITGFLIPNEEFIYMTLREIDSLVTKVNQTPYMSLQELEEQFGLSEQEIEYLLNDLVNVGKLHGEIRRKEGIARFITIKTLSETILTLLKKNGKLVISTYSRKSNVSIPKIRESIRSLLDSTLVDGHYTYNGALFYTEKKLERDMLEFLQASETASIGLVSITNQFQMSKEVITLILNNLVSKGVISGYISENTFFKKSYEEEKLRDLFNKYIDALNIIHILVIHQESGITVFSESYISDRIDPTLVSGMLHAITSFGSEISGIELAGLRLLEYKDYIITMSDGKLIRAALILKSAPSQRLFENLKHFVRFFDSHYRPHLEDFKGSIDPFKSASALVDEYFEISLNFPYEVQEKEVFKNRDRLSANELAVITQARGLGRQFLLKNLLESISKELLISQPEAFLIIYDLKEKNIFQVIKEERKWCPHCGSIIPKTATTCPHCLKNIEDTLL